MTECKKCLFTDEVVKIHDDGECEYCKLHAKQTLDADPKKWDVLLKKIKKKSKDKQYDCLIGISGGEDSSVLLYSAVKVWGLKPLVIHFNNRTNRHVANSNIRALVDHLNVNFIEFYLDNEEYNNLTDSLLKAGVPDADIGNDVCMAKLMVKTALDNNIKYILNGHSFREEGSSPKAWSVIDYTYLNSVYKKFNGKDLVNYPLLTVWDQIYSALRGIVKVSPFHYHHHNRPDIIKALKAIGWKDYGGKHNENIYTAFIGNHVLPKKFNIDKRVTYFSAQIREGKLSKQSAKLMLSRPAEFDVNDLGERRDHLLHLVKSSPIGNRSDYKMTNFKALKPLFWILAKLGVVPISMYNKYCK
jgi:hypothetical protein